MRWRGVFGDQPPTPTTDIGFGPTAKTVWTGLLLLALALQALVVAGLLMRGHHPTPILPLTVTGFCGYGLQYLGGPHA